MIRNAKSFLRNASLWGREVFWSGVLWACDVSIIITNRFTGKEDS